MHSQTTPTKGRRSERKRRAPWYVWSGAIAFALGVAQLSLGAHWTVMLWGSLALAVALAGWLY